MKNFKKKDGITLIALVVTIVVLLILAGVSIRLLLGNNGLISKAEGARNAYKQDGINTQTALDNLYGEALELLGEQDKVSVGVKAIVNSTINGEAASATNPIIPKGYIAINTSTTSWGDGSSSPTTENINKGLVITDSVDESGNSNGNEWVWVPVDSTTLSGMYATASTPITLTGAWRISDSATLTDLRKFTVNKYSKSGIISGITRGLPNSTSCREPDIVAGIYGMQYDAVKSNRTTAGFTKIVDGETVTMTLAEMAETMVDEYEEMLASIEKYKGFYIGRFELTANGEKSGKVMTNSSWYRLYAKCKELSASDEAVTRMIWGNQWDVACNWIANYGDQKSITDSSTWGNYSNYNDNYTAEDEEYVSGAGVKQVTGFSDYWKANNIYDLAGNCFEWTQEANVDYARCYRGGYWGQGGASGPVGYRFDTRTDDSGNNGLTTRATMVVK